MSPELDGLPIAPHQPGNDPYLFLRGLQRGTSAGFESLHAVHALMPGRKIPVFPNLLLSPSIFITRPNKTVFHEFVGSRVCDCPGIPHKDAFKACNSSHAPKIQEEQVKMQNQRASTCGARLVDRKHALEHEKQAAVVTMGAQQLHKSVIAKAVNAIGLKPPGPRPETACPVSKKRSQSNKH